MDISGLEPLSESFSDAERKAFLYGMNLAETLAEIQKEWVVALRNRTNEIHTILDRDMVGDIKEYVEREIANVKVSWDALPADSGISGSEQYRVVHIRPTGISNRH